MDSMWSIMDIIFAGAGMYALYAVVLMKTTGEIKTALLMGKDIELRKCKDLEGYKCFVMPKMIIFGISALLYGALGIINTYVVQVPFALYIAAMVLFFLVIVWYAFQTKKAVKMFW